MGSTTPRQVGLGCQCSITTTEVQTRIENDTRNLEYACDGPNQAGVGEPQCIFGFFVKNQVSTYVKTYVLDFKLGKFF